MPTKSEAIKSFLQNKTHLDLANLYNLGMECQVNVAQDNGERIDGEFRGKKWHGWTDGLQTWKSFRIPYHANTTPEYTDNDIKFDLIHADAIGMTGWDWENQVSRWVAFDFDAIIGHTTGLNFDELEEVKKAAMEIPWVTVRRSTGGKGYHLYVFTPPVKTSNHNEHAALARSILGKMSALSGFDFKSKVDICGGNMWVWARKMIGNGLELIKQGISIPESEIPANWHDHIKVVSGKARRILPQTVPDTFEELAGQRPRVPLDSEHQKLIAYLTEVQATWWWDQDHHMLVTHTFWLAQAHKELNLRGVFETASEGTEKQFDHNCFAFPLRKGVWVVRRFTPGVQEHEIWEQDGAGWTRCYLNRDPDISTAARAFGGIEDTKGGYVFAEAEKAIRAAALLGVDIQIAPGFNGREAVLKQHKDNRLIVEIERKASDTQDQAPQFLAKDNKPWTRIYNTNLLAPTEPEIGNFDDLVRHLVTNEEDSGWVLKSDGTWRYESVGNVRVALSSMGLNMKEITAILGTSVLKAWKIVNKPFQPEYPGDREWNRNAAQLRYQPAEEDGEYPTWTRVLSHCGKGLNDAVKSSAWCQANGVLSGGDYLKCWIASIFQAPEEPLPYLFFFGPQNSGKSIFHEALSILLTKGYIRADAALRSQSGFNAELEGAICCVVEEVDLRANKSAYNKIKDWVTSRDLLIHPKGSTPYHVPNTTKWIQCANDHNYCPIFPGDTRITVSYVDGLDPLELIPKRQLLSQLEKEASSFLREVMHIDLPPSSDRMNVPVLRTMEKEAVESINKTQLEAFLEEYCEHVPGSLMLFSEFFERFVRWTDEEQVWSKIRVGKEIPPIYPKGKRRKDGQISIGNIAWRDTHVQPSGKLICRGGYLDVAT